MPSPQLLSYLRHETMRRVCLAFTLGVATTTGCAPEPCQTIENVPVDPQTTPFSDGASVYSKCAACPELPKMDGVDASGPATVCRIGFADGGTEAAYVDCFYGPGGNTASSISNGAVTDVPNLFGFCEARCPDHDALHVCSLSADENGVQQFTCLYGRICG
jgi:hypothetical protein